MLGILTSSKNRSNGHVSGSGIGTLHKNGRGQQYGLAYLQRSTPGHDEVNIFWVIPGAYIIVDNVTVYYFVQHFIQL